MRDPLKFGNYYLIERVNIGGMAEVFKGVSYGVEGFERLFAVKRVLPNISEDQEFIEMFIDEAKIAVQLNHANIGQIFELGNAENSYFIAMEFVQGKDLRALFDRVRKRNERIDIPMTCHIVKEVCEALEYAHNKKNERQEALNLVHRDVSPQNIIVSYDGEVKLIDFGIAKAAGKASKTQAGILKGKFGYMSPEQVRGRPIDRRSDIFSLGVVLFELLTLERCFQGESDFSTLEKVRNVDIRRPASLNRDIPPELERIVLKALSRSPEERYQSAAELQDALQKFLYQSGSFYARKDLSGWMKRTFDADFRDEQRKLQAFREYARENIPEARRASSTPGIVREPDTLPTPNDAPPPPRAGTGPAFKAQLPSLSWEDDEVETSIWDQKPSDIIAVQDVQGTPPAHRDPPAFGAPAAAPAGPLPSEARPALSDTELLLPAQATLPARRAGDGRVAALIGITAVALLVAGVIVWMALSGQSAPARLTFETTPRAVTIFLDNALLHQGATPFSTDGVTAGTRHLRVEAEGYKPHAQDLLLEPGTEQKLTINLSPAQRSDDTGLELASEPGGAQVTIDGRVEADQTPMRVTGLTPGEHEIRLEKTGYLPYKGRVTAVGGQLVAVKTIRLAPAKVNLRFVSNPRGARITLESATGDRQVIGSTPTAFEGLDNGGGYTAIAELSGYPPQRESVGLFGDAEITVSFDFEQAARAPETAAPVAASTWRPRPPAAGTRPASQRGEDAPPEDPAAPATAAPATDAPPEIKVVPVGPGYLSVLAKPAAVAYINDEQVGETPLYKHELGPATYRVVLIRESEPKPYRRTFTVEVRPGETAMIRHIEP
ncbi:protein kinase [Myxococcota bacterium]|nr:protein kinase [Myxococcota bacterium]